MLKENNARAAVNRLLWDEAFVGKSIIIFYLDRNLFGEAKLKPLPLHHVEGVGKLFLYLTGDEEFGMLPLHRIRTITVDGDMVWQRV
jgi:uncharacterized protein (UPF0248 family)